MKKIVFMVSLLAMSGIAMGQEEQQPNDDQLQQQAPRETQVRTERAAKREAKKAKQLEKERTTNAEVKKDSVVRKKKVERRSTPN